MIKNNIRRESYLKFLNTWKNRDLIKVLSGVRRSGKSTLLAMFQQDLKEQGVQDENIIAINFEYMEFEELTYYRKLHDYVLSKVDKNKKNYVFLDEIQHVAYSCINLPPIPIRSLPLIPVSSRPLRVYSVIEFKGFIAQTYS